MPTSLLSILKPEKIFDIIGQPHLTNKNNGVIFKILEQKFLPSLILYGPPGTGKTSLALVIAKNLNYHFAIFNAAIDKKIKLEKFVEEAQKQKNYILIIEEIHRMNKDRQDILLQYIEEETFTIIACTTENVAFTINSALRSRCLMLELKPIDSSSMFQGLDQKLSSKKYENKYTKEALHLICNLASGDLRFAVNTLELASSLFPNTKIDLNLIKTIVPKAQQWNFKQGDEHHNLMSALQKSIRGSDINAAMYYLARMLASGDYEALLRRLLVIAYEDVGLANPAICLRVQGAIRAFREIGMPEGIIPLGLAVAEMSLSEKSNSSYLAINSALQDVNNGKIYPVPNHLKKPNSIKNYKYPHNFENAYIKQQYLPDELKAVKYYKPKQHNTFERKLIALYEKFTKK